MGNPFVQEENYEETITDPRDGDEWKVVFRVLNAGDDAVIRDETVIEIEEHEEGELVRTRVPMGRMRLASVEAAIVSWTLPMTLSRNAIKSLNGDIFDQIYAHVRSADAKAEKKEGEDPPTEAQTGDSKHEPSADDESSTSKPSS